MKRRLFLLALLSSLTLTGCDFIDEIKNKVFPSEDQKEEDEKKDEEPVSIQSISISGSLEKTTYYVGENWDSTGLSVNANYTDGHSSTLDEEYTFEFSPIEPTVGTQEVSITAHMSEDSFVSEPVSYSVVVSNKEIQSIVIEGDLTKKTYAENANWDPTGLQVRAVYDQQTTIILSNDKYQLTFDPTQAFFETTSVRVKAKLNNSQIESEEKVITGISVKHEYTITFNGNGATSGSMEPVKTIQSTYSAPACGFKKDGFKFVEWALNSASGTKYAVGANVPVTSNITLYATWEEKQGGESDIDEYYSSIDENATGATLKTELHNLIKITKAGWDYNGLWSAYETTDTRPDGYLWDIYSDKTQYTSSSNHSSYKKEGDCVNREHIIPQSTFNEAAPMKSDVYHVLPSDGYVNGQRSSYPHGIVSSASYTSNDGCKKGTGTGGGIVFEPKDCYKGDIARIYFYFVTCYENLLGSTVRNSGEFVAFDFSTYKSFKSAYLTVYLQWAKDDPVSEKEQNKNEAAYAVQKNRNPYVDHPEWVEQVFGD